MKKSMNERLAILSDAAKYDASCASSGSVKRTSKAGGTGVGSTDGGMGICHAYAPDGRCISLLKILLTNSCIFDCHYCINRKSSNVRRARFTAREVVDLTLRGQALTLMAAGPYFKQTEAFSLVIDCKDQAEVDYFWDALTRDGGQESQCGWLKDKFGVSWQVTPRRLVELTTDPDKARAGRAAQAMMTMKKIDIAAIEAAADGE